ncbi:hemogen-like [Apodemus sylvaticus]|uniref:hemogen-like n=1 Tax=Apodemus sylvaticus TaxID=10129 RepID=UPI002243E6ED|nr:hemogen-like [Apodemus sylvaticus]XP_052026247.1 hemogen-like [Apodemus sylvaticus]
MDLKKHPFDGIHYQTTDTDQEKTYEPLVIGSWHLRNREQLKKRKHEREMKQMLQWHLEEQKIHKRRRSRNANKKGLNKQQCSETNAEPLLQVEKASQVTPARKESQHSETEALPHLTSSPKDLLEEYCFEIHRESFICGENSARYHDTAVMNCFSETDQYLTGREDFLLNISQNTSGENSARYHDTSVMNCFSETNQYFTGPEDFLLNICQKSPESEKSTFEQLLKESIPEDFFNCWEVIPTAQTYGRDEPDYPLSEICKEITVPTDSYEVIEVTTKPEVNSLEPCQEICGDEQYAPEDYQEMPEIEDLSNKRHQNSDEPYDCFLEEFQETDTSEDQDTGTHQSVNT